MNNADEYLYEEDIVNIRIVAGILTDVKEPVLIRIGQMNKINQGEVVLDFDIARMFQLKHSFKFYSRIHE